MQEENKPVLNIKSWAEDDRPREKLLNKGKSSLSDAELLAILIGSGSKNETAVDLCKRIMASVNHDLNRLSELSINDLMKFRGIGEAKAITIAAALELGKRRQQFESAVKKQVRSSRDAFDLLMADMTDLPHEEFWVLYLNRANKLLAKERLSTGGISGTVTDVRLILKRCLELLSVQLIIAHNHPSGNLTPSQADKDMTARLSQAAKLMDVVLADHLIIAGKTYFSFADEGLLA